MTIHELEKLLRAALKDIEGSLQSRHVYMTMEPFKQVKVMRAVEEKLVSLVVGCTYITKSDDLDLSQEEKEDIATEVLIDMVFSNDREQRPNDDKITS
jgi:hypothetical protein